MKFVYALAVISLACALHAQTNEVGRVKVNEAVATTIEVADISPVPLAQMSEVEAEPVLPVSQAPSRTAWHDSIEAEKGSKAYWILYIARERAVRGEDTGRLALAFAQTLFRWAVH